MLKETNKQKFICHPEVLTEGSIDSSHSFRMTESGRSSSSSSFPCLTRESTWCGPNASRCAQYAQSGRSMVEMLGVLAVIGVLSVAGVGGYTTAMNKHRANELLNEASKRAAIVAMQMASGKDANIDEFKVNGTQDFTVSGKAGDATFTLSVANVDEAVCKQLVNAVGTTGAIRKITLGTTDITGDASKCTTGALVLTYNADLTNVDKELELGLKPNVPCGSGFCYEGQTCTDAIEIPDDGYRCGDNYLSEPGKCCVDSTNNSCPNSEAIWEENANGCLTCSAPDEFAANVDGRYVCCQKGTGYAKMDSDGHYAPRGDYPAYEFCCTSQGFYSDGDQSYACCKGNGYDSKNRPNSLCCGSTEYSYDVTVYVKKKDGSYAEIEDKYKECEDGTRGCFNPSDYLEWHCCNYYEDDGKVDETAYKSFCDAARSALGN